uniref:Uncharacterized protein n=1 Tax=Rhizophora mucronata TaxID=61149 RepID=A0A2P2PR78_RHIMU
MSPFYFSKDTSNALVSYKLHGQFIFIRKLASTFLAHSLNKKDVSLEL